MLPAQSVVACLRFHAFCKMHRRRGCSLLRAKREPERTAVPAGHESPSGAFKPQTGLRSKCCVFSTARSQRFQRAGSMKKGLLAPFRPQSRKAPYKKSKPLRERIFCVPPILSRLRDAPCGQVCAPSAARTLPQGAGATRCRCPSRLFPVKIESRKSADLRLSLFPNG